MGIGSNEIQLTLVQQVHLCGLMPISLKQENFESSSGAEILANLPLQDPLGLEHLGEVSAMMFLLMRLGWVETTNQ